MGAMDDLARAIAESGQQTAKPVEHDATVLRVQDGTIWVHVHGGADETPINGAATAEVRAGDVVRVSISGGKCSLTGNATTPSVGVRTVTQYVDPVAEIANAAQSSADTAASAASAAVASAASAATAASEATTAASNAATAASNAQTSADNANEYAARALGNLSTVQSVAETLAWITEHGTMALTADTAPDPTHVYFVADASGDYSVGGATYSVVTEPDADAMASYYELSIDESLNNYVGTHLALTSDGLWLIPASSGGYKILVSVGASGSAYAAGTHIVNASGTTVAWFGETVTIGASGNPQLTIDSLKLAFNGMSSYEISTAETYESDGPASSYGALAFGTVTTVGSNACMTPAGFKAGNSAMGMGHLANGVGTDAIGANQAVFGRYNVIDTEDGVFSPANTYPLIVGNGTASDARSNAHTLDWSGNAWWAGALSAASAALTGALSAASATLTGALSAASATLSGALSAASATITGAISAGSVSASGDISASGDVSDSVGTLADVRDSVSHAAMSATSTELRLTVTNSDKSLRILIAFNISHNCLVVDTYKKSGGWRGRKVIASW